MEKLKEYLSKRGMTQKELSKRSGVSESMISRIMGGHEPKIGIIMKIKKATNGQVRPEHWA
jgi:transcriptional regulator with XRE-family HTH domain